MFHKKRFHHFSFIIIGFLLTLLLSGCKLLFPVLPDSATIAGVSVGGLSKEEVTSVVENGILQSYQTQKMSITVGDHTVTVSPEQAEISLDVAGIVENIFKNRKHSANFDITPYFSINENAIRTLIQETEQKLQSTQTDQMLMQLALV